MTIDDITIYTEVRKGVTVVIYQVGQSGFVRQYATRTVGLNGERHD